jgi:hypothetical protein
MSIFLFLIFRISKLWEEIGFVTPIPVPLYGTSCDIFATCGGFFMDVFVDHKWLCPLDMMVLFFFITDGYVPLI